MSDFTMIYNKYKYLNAKLFYFKIYNHACSITYDQGSLIKKKTEKKERFAAQERNALHKTIISTVTHLKFFSHMYYMYMYRD